MPLMMALEQGKLDIARKLLEEGVDVNALHLGVYPPICAAVSQFLTNNNSVSAVKLLLEFGANVNKRSIVDLAALNFFVLSMKPDNYEIAKLLLENGADYNFQPRGFPTAFQIVLGTQSLGIIQLFIEYGADITEPASLHSSVRNSDSDVIEFVLDQGFDIECRINNRSALELAVHNYANPSSCKALIKRGAMVDKRNPFDNHTPLSLAVMCQPISKHKNSEIIVEMLLEHGANLIDKVGGRSIFEIAAVQNDNALENDEEPFKAKNENVTNILIRQIVKMKYMNLNIYEEDLQKMEQNDCRRKYYHMCVHEMEQMKNTRFYNNVSLFSIFMKSKNRVAGYARNQKLVDALEENEYEKKFPIYFDSLKQTFITEVLRQRIRISVAKTLSGLFQFANPFHPVNQKILDCIQDEDLKFLEM